MATSMFSMPVSPLRSTSPQPAAAVVNPMYSPSVTASPMRETLVLQHSDGIQATPVLAESEVQTSIPLASSAIQTNPRDAHPGLGDKVLSPSRDLRRPIPVEETAKVLDPGVTGPDTATMRIYDNVVTSKQDTMPAPVPIGYTKVPSLERSHPIGIVPYGQGNINPTTPATYLKTFNQRAPIDEVGL